MSKPSTRSPDLAAGPASGGSPRHSGTRFSTVGLALVGTRSADIPAMVDPAELAKALVDRLHDEHVTAIAGDAVHIDELERRRGELAREAERLLERIKRAANA